MDGPQQLPPIILEDDFAERHRIAWRAEQARFDPHNPLLEGEYPWDDGTPAVGHGTILKDPLDGKFKGWTPVMAGDTPEQMGWAEFRLAYIESEDGIHWRRPWLGIAGWAGYEGTNLIFDYDSGGRATYASVSVDAAENPAEPYEMFCFREPYWKCPALSVAGFNQAPARDARDARKYYGLYRYRSSDGIHWRGVAGPLNLATSDSCYIFRDPKIGYVSHHKSVTAAPPANYIAYDCAPGLLRVARRRTSPDGIVWSDARPLADPDWHDNAGDQIMEVGRYPYGTGFLGLVTVYHAVQQRMDVQWSASADGEKFWRPIPRTPCVPNISLGDYGGGMIWPYRLPVEDGGRLYIYYGALAGLHGDVYKTSPDIRLFRGGALCRASWDMGRFIAAINADGGGAPPAYLTTHPIGVTGKALYLNAVTRRQGEIRVELLDGDFQPIPGFSKDDNTPFRGDEKLAPVTWQGGITPPCDAARVRFYLTTAMLYGYAWR